MTDEQLPEHQTPLTNPNPPAAKSVICGGIAFGALATCSIPQLMLAAMLLSPLLGFLAIVFGVGGISKSSTLPSREGGGKSRLGITLGVLALIGSLAVWLIAYRVGLSVRRSL